MLDGEIFSRLGIIDISQSESVSPLRNRFIFQSENISSSGKFFPIGKLSRTDNMIASYIPDETTDCNFD